MQQHEGLIVIMKNENERNFVNSEHFANLGIKFFPKIHACAVILKFKLTRQDVIHSVFI